MSSASSVAPAAISDNDLALLVANASFLWERLAPEQFSINDHSSHSAEIERRCDRWRQVVGQDNWDTLHKRLHWDGLDFNTVRQYLGVVQWNPDQPLPEWANTLQQIMQVAMDYCPTSETVFPTDSNNPLPFEEVLLPVIQAVRQQLLTRLGVTYLTEEDSILSVISLSAYLDLERSLLRRLSMLSVKTLEFEFSQVRPFGQSLLSLIGIEDETEHSRTYYNQFTNQLLQDGLLSFFQKYPVLARFIATASLFWIEATAELIQRLVTDQQDIQKKFAEAKGYTFLGKVTKISTSLSDPHHQGRTVAVLAFESGLKLVYKPKSLALEVVYNQLLEWCNQNSQLLDFKVIRVLDRNTYGWVEFVEHESCTDEAAAQRFYQRAGMLLCLLYTLRGTDCHDENLIASGEHLVLIDTETLLHHDANLIENSPIFREMETDAGSAFWDSVLRTGLLPHWDFSADHRVAYDISGLGSTEAQLSPQRAQAWQAINTDNMHLQYITFDLPIKNNVPRLNGIALSPNAYQAQITAGFEQMYRFLIENQATLLSPVGPLAALQEQRVRFVFRPTRVYFSILERTWAPDYLKYGVDFSIEIDHLSRAFLVAQDKPIAWPLLRAEIQAMEQLDIPFFAASVTSEALVLDKIQDIPHFFKQPSYQQMQNQILRADEAILSQQIAIIQGAFYARVAKTSPEQYQPWQAKSLTPLTSEELLEEAKAIATELAARAIQEPNGSLNWVGMGFVPGAGRFQLQVLGDNLYDGRCGIALFFAALYRITQEAQFQKLALDALHALRRQIQIPDVEFQKRFARLAGIGGTSGLGSLIYALVNISQFLDKTDLLVDAHSLAEFITPELIESDQDLDIIAGAAGALLSLLSLYRITHDATVLEKAVACGQHLLNQQVSYEKAPKAWLSFAERPLTGFSHGAAGIAYALMQLYSVTHKSEFLEAAQQGLEYERNLFSEMHGNWPDLRGADPHKEPIFPVQWCYGASGIGLGRLGILGILKTPEIQREIEIALQTTQNYGLNKIDHLCCGNLGRAETLLVGAQRLGDRKLYDVALQQVTNVIHRAKHTGSYQLFPNLPGSVFNPGFFQGVSGIGYSLLRFAYPELPSILMWE